MTRCPACGRAFEEPDEAPDHAAVVHGRAFAEP
jgi:uncharacterized C2H2 Zn-finger protein